MTEDDYTTPRENLPPTIPVERFDPPYVRLTSAYECSDQIRAQRIHNEGHDTDDILVTGYHHGSRVGIDLRLSPAMIVHLANTMLTNTERVHIVAPDWSAMTHEQREALLNPPVVSGAAHVG